MTCGPAGRLGSLRPVTSASLLLLFLLLPALIAGVSIDAEPAPGEALRVAAASDPTVSTDSPVARMYYGLMIPADSGADAEQTLVLARRSQVLGILALTGLLYLSVRVMRGRSIAVLACLALAALPPVASEGYVLRPETPAALFGSLGLLLLQGLPAMIESRHRSPVMRGLSQVALMSAVGVALALAVSALSSYRFYLLLPAAMLLLTVSLLSLRFWRVMRRRGVARLPTRAFPLRLLPWVGTAFFTLFFSLLLFSSELAPSPVPQASTPSDSGLLPGPLALRLPFLALAGLGAFGLLMRTGVTLGRTARLSAATVMLAYVAIMLSERLLGGGGTDALPAAPALAFLVAEGAGVLWVIAAPRLWGRRESGSASGKAGTVPGP